MCLTYMNCMTFDNKQFTDLKKNGFCGTEVHYTFKVMFFIIKVFDWTIAQVAVRPTTHLLQQTFIPGSNQEGNIYFLKFQLFNLSIQKNDGFFLRCQDTISVPKIRGMQFLTLHILPLYRIYIIEIYTLDLHAFVMQNILLHML